MENVAVITGDVVKSRKLSTDDLVALMSAIEHQLTNPKSQLAELYSVKGEIFRGDSFQCVCKPSDAINTVWLLQCLAGIGGGGTFEPRSKASRKASLKMAIAIGPATIGATLANSHGETFEQAGQALDSKTDSLLRLRLTNRHQAETEAFARLTSTIMQDMTQIQCLYLMNILIYRNIKLASQYLGVNQSTISRSIGSIYKAVQATVAYSQTW